MSHSSIRGFIATAVILLAFAGCGNRHTTQSDTAPAEVDSDTTGSITGTVTLEGTLPTAKPIDMSASPACVQANATSVVPQTAVIDEGRNLANVVVYLKNGLLKYHFKTPSEPAVLVQQNCMYVPHVVALMTNQPFEVVNDDPTMHNVHPLPKNNRQWSTSQSAGSSALKFSFARPEFAMPMLCSVHPWMSAFVFAFDNPYFAVTSKTGRFELRNVPSGTYTVEAWQEYFGTQDRTVTVGPKEVKTVSFTFTKGRDDSPQ
jgi:hypothetical protein